MPLVAGGYPPQNRQYALNGKPSALFRENIDRAVINADLAALTTQVMTSVAVALMAGDIVSRIAFKSGATAANTPTNWWFALYDDAATPNLLAQTADQLTGAWAADTAQDLVLSAPQFIPRSGIYYAAIMVKATAVPSLLGASLNRAGASTGLISGQKALGQTSGAALIGAAPATIATPTAVATVPYCVLR